MNCIYNRYQFILITLGALTAAFVLLVGQFFSTATAGAQSPAQRVSGQDLALLDTGLPTDQIIIKFVDRADPAKMSQAGRDQFMDQLSQAAGVQLEMVRPMSGDAYVMRVPEKMAPSAVLEITNKLQAQRDVLYAEPDLIKQAAGDPLPGPPDPNAVNLTPNDPMFGSQWHYNYSPPGIQGANLPAAWDITTGTANVDVGIVDTGVLVGHPDLSAKIVPGYDFIGNVDIANDGDGRDANPDDPGDWVEGESSSSWHGTHVAGTVGAHSNNGIGVAGINWQAKIQPIRVLGRGGGFMSDIIDGSRWSAGLAVPGVPSNTNSAKVINLSLGGPGACSVTEQKAFNDIIAAGTTVVIAAGNNNYDAANFSPGNCNNVITVAASNKTGSKANFSNFGSIVEITAPGVAVLSTLNNGTTSPGAYSYKYYQGTSMAAPHVAGVASLIIGQNMGLTPAQVLNILQSSSRAFPGGSTCNTTICGSGLLDAGQALAGNTSTPTATAITPTNTPTPEGVPVTKTRLLGAWWFYSPNGEKYFACLKWNLCSPDSYVQFYDNNTLYIYKYYDPDDGTKIIERSNTGTWTILQGVVTINYNDGIQEAHSIRNNGDWDHLIGEAQDGERVTYMVRGDPPDTPTPTKTPTPTETPEQTNTPTLTSTPALTSTSVPTSTSIATPTLTLSPTTTPLPGATWQWYLPMITNSLPAIGSTMEFESNDQTNQTNGTPIRSREYPGTSPSTSNFNLYSYLGLSGKDTAWPYPTPTRNSL